MATNTRIRLLALILSVEVLVSCSTSCAADYIAEGITSTQAGKTDRAIESWTRAIRKNPRSYEAHLNRGSAYLMSGHVFRGIMDWHRASELSPAFAYAVYTGDFVGQSSGRGRLLNYVVSIELDPDRIVSVLMMGMMYLDLGQSEKVAELYRKSANLTKNPLLKSELDYWANMLETPPKER